MKHAKLISRRLPAEAGCIEYYYCRDRLTKLHEWIGYVGPTGPNAWLAPFFPLKCGDCGYD